MEGWKGILTSKTFWSAALAIVAVLAGQLGYSVTEADTADILNQIMAGVAVIGGLGAIYGRIKATKVIGKPDSNVEAN